VTLDNTVPILMGALAGLIGGALLFDAWTPDDVVIARERRRRPRVERHRGGEAMVGLGVLAMAAAFFGGDSWRYSVVAVLAGIGMMIVGAALNRSFLGQVISNRGALRRGAGHAAGHGPDAPLRPPPDPVDRGGGQQGTRVRIR
jgi:peptidoglycan/LPS O-acetylase OafA/YrhL